MANSEQTEQTVLPLAEAAARLGLSSDALRMRIRRGKARGFKKGRHVYVYLDDVGPGAGPAAGGAEQQPNRPAGSGRGVAPPGGAAGGAAGGVAGGAAGGGPWSMVVETQKQEMARLIDDIERLNQRLDRQFDEARELREMLQREQVLRQQEQSLRHELQDMLERLVAQPALARPAAETPPGEGSSIIMRAAGQRGTGTGAPAAPGADTVGAAREAAEAAPQPPVPEPASQPAPEAAAQPAPEPASQPAEDRPVEAPAAAPSSEVPPEAEDLADMLKEIGESLRDLDDDGAAGGSDPEDERRAAARVMSRLFRGRTPPRPPES